MRRSMTGLSVALFAGALATAPAAAAPLEAEVVHWWTSGGEAAALRVFADAFARAGGTWIDTAIAGGGGAQAKATGLGRIVGGNPPAAMQFNYGQQFDEIIAHGYVVSLDDVAAAEGWQKVLPPTIWNSVVRDGHVWAVPVDVHGIDWAWWSPIALKKAGAEVPNDWDELFAVLDRLKAAGVVPLALGGQPWQEELLFNFVVNSQGGKALFRALYVDHDAKAVASPEFRRSVETFLRLKAYVDPGSPGRNWNDATAMVIAGTAGFQVMGDWAKGEFSAAGLTAGRDYLCRPGFGDRGGYVFGGDIFVMIVNRAPGVAEAQKLLARTMLSPEVQVAFNSAKGGIPVRPDVDASKMDVCARAGVKLMAVVENQLPNLDYTNSPDQVGAYRDAITELWNAKTPNVDAFLAKYARVLAM